MRLRTLSGVASALVASTALFAAQEGALKVTVLKPDHTPLAGVVIRANVAVSSPTQINSVLTTRTDDRGIATFYKLTPGIFTIQVEVDGYEAGAIRTDVAPDHTSHLQVLLRPLPAVEVGIEDTFDALDPTNATTGLNVKPEMIFTIPISSRIADSALLVPGVILSPTAAQSSSSPSMAGDPSLLVSVNRDMFGLNYFSTNNYLLDGINVSHPIHGRGMTNVMQDLLAGIEIKTGGVTAEYQAKSGIFYNATTINGSNEFHGGISSEYTPNGLRANPKAGRPSINETAQSNGFWFSGPLIKSKLWFVVGAQKSLSHGTTILGEGTGAYPGEKRPYTVSSEENLFAKLTWQASPVHRFIGEFHSNRSNGDNGDQQTLVTSWISKTEAGGDRALLWYSFQQPWLIADIKIGHDYQRTRSTDKNPTSTSVSLYSPDPITPVESQLGSVGARAFQHTDRYDYRADFVVPFNTRDIAHTLKFGYESQFNRHVFDLAYTVPYYQNIDRPLTYGEMSDFGLTYLPWYAPQILDTINNNPTYATIKNHLTPAGQTEVGYGDLLGYTFNERDPDGHGFLASRIFQTVDSNLSVVKSNMKGFYVQDYLTWNNLTVSPGFRLDSYSVTNDVGVRVFNQKNLFAPRFSVSWDVMGDARSRLYAYFGRYFNPEFGVTDRYFGMTKTNGNTFDVRLDGQWVNLMTLPPSGGAENMNYIFANDTTMPYTDEVRLGYDKIIKGGKAVHTLSIAGSYRKDKNPAQYVDALTYSSPDYMEAIARQTFGISNVGDQMSAAESKVISAIRNLAFPTEKFAGAGFTGEENVSMYRGSYINIPTAERTFKSLDLSYKVETTNSIFLASFSWLDAQGNTMEAGDTTWYGLTPVYDPRLPWMHGHVDGSYDWAGKIYGSYRFSNDFIVGLFTSFNSGYHYSPMTSQSGYFDLPTNADDLLSYRQGQKMTPKQFLVDLHLEKRINLSKQAQLWLSANVSNLFNNQAGTAIAEGVNVRQGYEAGQPYRFNAPRSIALRAKIRF